MTGKVVVYGAALEPGDDQALPEEAIGPEYMGSADRTAFMFYEMGTCVGHIRLKRNWNGYCLVGGISA
jgi:hypothetical protein